MILFLRIVGALALMSAALGSLDLVALTRPGATVFQQISARVDLGFSLLVMVTAFGLSSIAARLSLPGDAASDSTASPRSSAKPPKGTPVAKHEGIDIYKERGSFVAIVNGERSESSDLDMLKLLITAKLENAA